MKSITRILVVLLTLCCTYEADAKRSHHQNENQVQRDVPGQFDYYLLSLSWSPDYCSGHAGDTQQCGSQKRFGFVLHGLWPQYQKGYPQNCSNVALPEAVKQDFAGLYPSDKLFDHEWPKHGTCSGLSPADYLALSKQLKDGVAIPGRYQAPSDPFRVTVSDLQRDFSQSNPSIPIDAITMICSGSGRFLQEIHVCFNKDGQATSCGADVQKQMRSSCRQPNFLVKSVG
jgi:ribonuclease T2